MPSGTPQQRYLGQMTAKTAYTLAGGRVALTSLTTAHEKPIGMGGSINRQVAAEVQVIGTGADNATINFKLWAVHKSTPAGNAPATADLRLIASGTATLGTCTLASGDDLLRSGETASSVRIADTISLTQTDYGAALATAMGSPGVQVSSPADNTPAVILVPDLGDADPLIEFDLGTATGADAIVRTLN